MQIFVDDQDTEDLELGELGLVAIVRREIDYETDQRLMSTLAPVSVDLETGRGRVGDIDLAGASLALLRAYLVGIRNGTGEVTPVPPERVGRLAAPLGEAIARGLRKKREEREAGKVPLRPA